MDILKLVSVQPFPPRDAFARVLVNTAAAAIALQVFALARIDSAVAIDT
jgi:hypothetical protein